MALEIERKFLVHGFPWQDSKNTGMRITQGYLSTDPSKIIRLRLSISDKKQSKAFITIKSFNSMLSSREYEYPIPPDDAEILFKTIFKPPFIEKIRYKIPYGEHIWEVDNFLGDNAGLVLAEIELKHEQENFSKPPWLLEEVTHQVQYKNSRLIEKPFRKW